MTSHNGASLYRLERVTVSPCMKEQLQSLDKSRDGLMVTFEHHAKVWRDLEREKERKKEGPLRSGQPGLDQCLP